MSRGRFNNRARPAVRELRGERIVEKGEHVCRTRVRAKHDVQHCTVNANGRILGHANASDALDALPFARGG
jgi:hypothetical protein